MKVYKDTCFSDACACKYLACTDCLHSRLAANHPLLLFCWAAQGCKPGRPFGVMYVSLSWLGDPYLTCRCRPYPSPSRLSRAGTHAPSLWPDMTDHVKLSTHDLYAMFQTKIALLLFQALRIYITSQWAVHRKCLVVGRLLSVLEKKSDFHDLFEILVQALGQTHSSLQTDTIGSYKSAESFLSAKEEIEEPSIVLRSSALDE